MDASLTVALTIAALLAVMLFELRRQKSLAAAPVVYPLPWIASLCGLIVGGDMFWPVSVRTLCIVVGGYVLFCLGFEGSARLVERHPVRSLMPEIPFSPYGLVLLVLLSAAIGAAFVPVLLPAIDFEHLLESWIQIRWDAEHGTFRVPYMLTVLRYFVRCAFWFLTLKLVWSDRDAGPGLVTVKKKRIAIAAGIAVLALAAVVISFYDISRNDVMFIVIPVAFILMLKDRYNNERNVLILASVFVFAAVFCFFYFRVRGPGALDRPIDSMLPALDHYLSGGIVAFDQTVGQGLVRILSGDGGGRYTFSGILGLFGRLTGEASVPPVVEAYIPIGDGRQINVYTVYYWTAKDFGVCYALFWQFLFGALYGWLYRIASKGSEPAVYAYSLLSYPMLMMFFTDQYFSIGQSWLILTGFSMSIFAISFCCAKLEKRSW